VTKKKKTSKKNSTVSSTNSANS